MFASFAQDSLSACIALFAVSLQSHDFGAAARSMRIRSHRLPLSRNLQRPIRLRISKGIELKVVRADVAVNTESMPEEPVQKRRHPRMTIVRLFNSIVILSLGIPKAVSTAKSELATSNTLDWNFGIVWGLMYVDLIDTWVHTYIMLNTAF